jgi:hypothetical protein
VADRGLALSVVVVAHDMARELPRTLRSLSTPYQRHLAADEYEVIVVDNGSPQPIDARVGRTDGGPFRSHRIWPAPASPAHAANVGIAQASAELVGLVIDGARIASPGLLAGARAAARLAPRAVLTAPAWHLGQAPADGRRSTVDRRAEDELLARVDWERDGYDLFSVSTPAPSSGRGLFGPMGESSSLFLDRLLWDELGGLDERFALPGGGLVNHDLYRRACSLEDAHLVVLLGEGTFHQAHGGASTSGRVTRSQMWDEYEAIRGQPHQPPRNVATFVGQVPRQYMAYLQGSVERARTRV